MNRGYRGLGSNTVSVIKNRETLRKNTVGHYGRFQGLYMNVEAFEYKAMLLIL